MDNANENDTAKRSLRPRKTNALQDISNQVSEIATAISQTVSKVTSKRRVSSFYFG